MKYLKNWSKESRLFKKRLIVASLVIFALSFVLLANLFKLQVINYQYYREQAENNQLKNLTIEPNRGLIFDRNGVLLAENIPAYNLMLATAHLKKLPEIITRLQTIITFTPNELSRLNKLRQNREHLEYLPIKYKLSPEEIAKFYLNQYQFPELLLEATMIRNYPCGSACAHVVGYVGKMNKNELREVANEKVSDYIGKAGIEKYYEKLLAGKRGYKTVRVGAAGQVLATVATTPPQAGQNIYLTIDSQLQKIIQQAFAGEKGAAVVIDPNTGEILALVSNPSYDPNLFFQNDPKLLTALYQDPDQPMYNRATQGRFPFGSTIKPFLALKALDDKIVTPQLTIDDPGEFKLENSSHVYRDWKIGGHGQVNLQKALIVSCDTYFYRIATKLGINRIAEILTAFGFATAPDCDIQEVSSGIVATPSWKQQNKGTAWYPGDTVLSSIGQGFMSTTILQLAQATAILAMRGTHFKPYLLGAVQDHEKPTLLKPTLPQELPKINLAPEHWRLVNRALQQVIISQQGTAYIRFGQPISYTVAGKTGEVQLYRRHDDKRKDMKEIQKRLRNHNLFIAFAPFEHPQIALAVISENSNFAVKIARKICDYAVH